LFVCNGGSVIFILPIERTEGTVNLARLAALARTDRGE